MRSGRCFQFIECDYYSFSVAYTLQTCKSLTKTYLIGARFEVLVSVMVSIPMETETYRGNCGNVSETM